MVFIILIILGILFDYLGRFILKYISKKNIFYKLLNFLIDLPWLLFSFIIAFISSVIGIGMLLFIPFLIISILIQRPLDEIYKELIVFEAIISLVLAYFLTIDKEGTFYYKRLTNREDDETIT